MMSVLSQTVLLPPPPQRTPPGNRNSFSDNISELQCNPVSSPGLAVPAAYKRIALSSIFYKGERNAKEALDNVRTALS